MRNFLKELEIMLNSGDPEVRTWFLIRHNYLPFILCGSYALFSTIIGPAIMKNRKAYDLRKVMIFFNFFLVATYTVTLATIFYCLPQFPREEFCKGSKLTKYDFRYYAASAVWVLYILKYTEFLDTVFFILRKKQNQVTFLHVIHHTIVPFMCWVILRTETSGMMGIPGIINAVVHVIMYSYYGMSAFGPQVRKYLWWKKYLTQIQMIQFLLIIILALVVIPLSGCKIVITSYIMQIVLAPLFFYLFYLYYRRSFQLKNIR